MSAIHKLPPLHALLSQTPPVVKIEIEDDRQNVAACLLLNNELFMHTDNDGVTLSAIDRAYDALTSQMLSEGVLIQKRTEESALDIDWDDFIKELHAYIDDNLLHSGAMPIEFEYESVVFSFDEYHHFINQLHTDRHIMKIADSETRLKPFFADQYKTSAQRVALCLEIEANNDEPVLNCGILTLISPSLEKAVLLNAEKITTSTDNGITLYYVTFNNNWNDVVDEFDKHITDLEKADYRLSCDPLSVMQADDASATVSLTHENHGDGAARKINSLSLRYFDPAMDKERTSLPVSIKS